MLPSCAPSAIQTLDKSDPDVAVFVHLVKDEATFYLDASGDSLHRRGWRAKGRDAPLKERRRLRAPGTPAAREYPPSCPAF